MGDVEYSVPNNTCHGFCEAISEAGGGDKWFGKTFNVRLSRDSLDKAIEQTEVVTFLNIGFERVGFDRTTAYANYYIYTSPEDDSRHLMVNGQDASRTDSLGIGHPYIEYFEDQIFDGHDAGKNVLVLGAGGFTLGKGREHGATLTFVDVDAQLRDLAASFHEKTDSIDGEFVVEDARAVLLESSQSYDEIVLDTFSHATSVPVHLLTIEFFYLVHSRLAESGRVHMNFIASDVEGKRFRRGIDNTVRAVFGDCVVHRIDAAGTELYNMLYSCTKGSTDRYRVIYSDADTRVSVESANP